MLEADKCTQKEEKRQLQERFYELNGYNTHEDNSNTAMVIKNVSDMSLKDLDITQLKESIQELKGKITTTESEDSVRDIRTLKENIDRFEERIIG